MTDSPDPDQTVPSDLAGSGDPELIQLVRDGDAAAYDELFRRHHDVAFRYARRISNADQAEDLSAEAFAKILDLLQRGKGPQVAFRAYLLTTVRTSHLNTIRARSREDLVPDHEPVVRQLPVTDDPDARFNQGAIERAFAELPERWQAALWLTTVEGLSNEEAGAHLGIKPNAVASLAFRARAGLRQAYLSQHLLERQDPHCRRVVELLPSHLRGTLTPRRRKHVDEHLAGCASCTTAALELSDVDTRLGALLAPLALTGFTVGTTAVAGTGALLAGLKGGAAVVIGHLQAWKVAAIPATTGAKVAVVASVAAAGLAVGTQVLIHHPDPGARPGAHQAPQLTSQPQYPGDPGESPSSTPTATQSPAAVTGTPAAPGVVLGTQSTTPVGFGPTAAPSTPGTTPLDPTPSSGPTSAPVTPDSGPPARAMAMGDMSTTRVVRDFGRWNRVSIPVANAAKGTELQLATDRTLAAELVVPTSSGWICGTPKIAWNDGKMFAKTTTSCVYNGHGDGSDLLMEYQVGGGSHLRAALTAPPSFLDTSLLDNSAVLALLT